jgi:POT family proton-dependent oligopeptide transporter
MADSPYLTAPVKNKGMPKGIPYIIGNEAAERFSFYGMRSVLMVFMTTYLIQPGGALDVYTDQEAKGWVHLFVASAYFFPVIGALIADAFWGKYRTIITLSLVYCAGHGCLAFMGVMGDTKGWLLAGLFLIAVGAGGIKPCVSAHVGDQFGKSNGHLLSKVFGWFYFSINLGAFASGMLTPFLLEATAGEGMGAKLYPHVQWLVGAKGPDDVLFGPHYAFGLPGVLMALATWVFWMGRHKFVHIQARGKEYFAETFSREGLKIIGRIFVVFAFIIVFWSLFDQVGTTWLIQAKSLNRVIPEGIPWIGGQELLPAQISAVFNPLFILLLIPVFNYGVYPLIDRVFPLTPLRKIGIGLFTMSAAFGMVAVVQMVVDGGGTPHMGWQILACALLTAAEVMVSITGLEFAYTQAPRQMKSFVLSLFLLTVSLGNFLTAGVTWLNTAEDGNSRFGMTQELWFWAGLIFLTAAVFIPVAMAYKPKEYLQDEAESGETVSSGD